ncbi:MAG: S8 family serine peptidase [Bacteroidetes bacterium]|nr:S8 family serine peptidase [Bacteroidota bacterium]
MKKQILTSITKFTPSALLVLLVITTTRVPIMAQQQNSFIIKFRDGTQKLLANKDFQTLTSQLKPAFPTAQLQSESTSILSNSTRMILNELQRYYVLTIDNGENLNEKIKSIQGNIESIAPNHKFHLDKIDSYPNDSLFETQWNLKRIGAEKAWKSATGNGVLVGVLDTGIDFLHPDLQKQLWINSKEDINHTGTFEPWSNSEKRDGISGDLNGIDDDGNGYTDDVIGYDFVDQSLLNIGDAAVRDAIPYDEQGHGTSVSGVIGAQQNNTIGISGIAYNCKLVTLRAFDATGNAEEDDIAAAIVYAALNGVKVINMSFGDVISSPITHDACRFADAMGVVLIASAGNDGSTLRRFPASYPEVIAVAATNDRDSRASFSSYGSHIALSAPGVGIPTTSVGGRYKPNFQGTSASAPHVSAAVALLFEMNSSLTPKEVRGILQASCDDVGPKGWDTDFGAGVLNIGTAVTAIGSTNISIASPINDAVFRSGNITITGSIATPLFTSWQLWLGKGELPPDNAWQKIGDSSKTQILNGTLGTLSVAQMDDTVHTLRLVVQLTNGNTIERRVRFDVASKASNRLAFSGLSPYITTAWRDDKLVAVISARFNRRCRLSVNIRTASNSQDKNYTDYDRFALQHELVFGAEDLIGNESYLCEVMGIIAGVDTVRTNITITRPNDAIQQTLFERKDYSTLPAQLNNSVKDVHGEGPSFAINDLSSGYYGATKIIQYKDGKMTTRDSTNESWLPRGMGDSNGDGITEVLTQSLGFASLVQGKTKQDSPFSGTLFTEKQVLFDNKVEFWSAAMADINGDGREELIGFADTACLVYTFRNGKYELLAVAPNDTPRGESGSENAMRPPNCAVGDFDGDGNIELCYGDNDGDFLIFEYKNGTFTKEFQEINSGVEGGTEYVTSADVDGDGKPEILIGYYTGLGTNADREYDTPFWTFKLLKSTDNNLYRSVWSDRFYGVRAGSEYRSGASAGNLDKDKGDEIVIAPFPNLYVFKWNTERKTMEPIWNYSVSYTNSMLIHDFDGNGTNELGFSDGQQTSFWEIPTTRSPVPPAGLTALALDSTQAVLRWKRSPDAESYDIFVQRNPTPQTQSATLIASTTADSLLLDTLTNYTLYRFFVRSVSTKFTQTTGKFSLPADAYNHPRLKVKQIAFRFGNKVLLTFTGLLGSNPPHLGAVKLLQQNGNEVTVSSIEVAGDSSLLVIPANDEQFTQVKTSVESFADRFGTPTLPFTDPIWISFADTLTRELYLSILEVLSPTSLRLQYSEPFDNSALKPGNYELKSIGEITDVQQISDSSVLLSLNPNIPIAPLGKEYTITVRNVFAASGRPITKGAGNTLGFTLVANSADGAYVFPNPVKITENSIITFGNLPHEAEVTVYSLEMKILATLKSTNNNGGVEWNARTLDSGDLLQSGVYLFKVKGIDSKGEQTESSLKKFGVVR